MCLHVGTALSGCIFYLASFALNNRDPSYINSGLNGEMITQYASSEPVYNYDDFDPNKPALDIPILLTGGHLKQTCFAASNFTKFCPDECSCSYRDNGIELDCLSLNHKGCAILLPAIDIRAVHFIRQPIDIVVSSYLYHTQEPAPEEWLKSFKTVEVGSWLLTQGVPKSELEAVGWFEEDLPLHDYYKRLNPKQAVLATFWHYLPDMYRMARQHLMLKEQGHPYYPARLESFGAAFTKTALATLRASGLTQTNSELEALRAAVQKCDLNSKQKLETIDYRTHVSAATHETKQELYDVLLGRAEVAEHLCALTLAMDYQPVMHMQCNRRN